MAFPDASPHPFFVHSEMERPENDGGFFEAAEMTGATIGWNELTKDEQTALKRMNRGPYPELSAQMAERLIALGLAEDRPRGIGINRAGRDLVINTLLAARETLPSGD
jgi:hypothetical protein